MSAKWIDSLGSVDQLPRLIKGDRLLGFPDTRVGFVGRSNAGKSSLINALTKSRVAEVSQSPGRTRLVRFYTWGEVSRIVVDFPGYGFAKASSQDQKMWMEVIAAYLEADPALSSLMMCMDSKVGMTETDSEALGFFESLNIPVHLVYTKWDRLRTQADRKSVTDVMKEWESTGRKAFVTSVTSKHGLKELTRYIENEDPFRAARAEKGKWG